MKRAGIATLTLALLLISIAGVYSASVKETWIQGYNPLTKRYQVLPKGWLFGQTIHAGDSSTTLGNFMVGSGGAATGVTLWAATGNITNSGTLRTKGVVYAAGGITSTGAVAEAAGTALALTAPAGGSAAGTTGKAGGPITLTGGAGTVGTGTTSTAGAGGAVTLTTGAGGTSTTGVGGAGGAISGTAGNGGATSGAGVGGAGGAASLTGGTGGAATGGTGGVGGAVTIQAGVGGAATTPGVGGALNLYSGAGGASGGAAGALTIKVGGASGAAVLSSTAAQGAAYNVVVNPLRNISAGVSTSLVTLAVATHPSGSVIVCTHATPYVDLPAPAAANAGVMWTVVNGGVGTTSFTVAAPTGVIIANALDSGSLTCTTLVWSTSSHIVGVSATFVSNGTSWIMIASTATPTTHT